jgi:hypothetical protein
MLRCVLLGALLALPCAVSAQQFQRNFPADALRGELRFEQPPAVLLNGREARLAPGVRIRGENNLLQMSGALAGQKAVVHYTVDDLGLIKDVWVLQAGELANKPWPTTPKEAASWAFDPVGQRWAKP